MIDIPKPKYTFCPKCGNEFGAKEINGKNELFCASCNFVFWVYPVPSVTLFALNSENKVLLIKKSKGNIWAMPGGYIDWGEDPEEALRREVKEEAGIKLSENIAILDAYNDILDPSGTGVEIFYFISNFSKLPNIPNTEEIKDAGYFDLKNLPTPINSIHNEVIGKYLLKKYNVR